MLRSKHQTKHQNYAEFTSAKSKEATEKFLSPYKGAGPVKVKFIVRQPINKAFEKGSATYDGFGIAVDEMRRAGIEVAANFEIEIDYPYGHPASEVEKRRLKRGLFKRAKEFQLTLHGPTGLEGYEDEETDEEEEEEEEEG